MATDLICIEVFCGQARLSQSLKSQSFRVFSIDHKPFKNVSVLQIDLNSIVERKLFWDLVFHNRVLYVHFAPPCGTASAARQIRLHKTSHGPRPLRDLANPMGLDTLSPVEQERVDLANNLYGFVAEACQILQERSIGWSIENPSSSLMWITEPTQALCKMMGANLVAFDFDTCMFGATRLKHTALWTNISQLQQLERRCDGSHTHEPWGQVGKGFATALECAYNKPLADAWAACIKRWALDLGVIFAPPTLNEVTMDHKDMAVAFNKAAIGSQPRGKKLPPVMTDLLEASPISLCAHPELCDVAPGSRLSSSSFPPGARLLRFETAKGGSGGEAEQLSKSKEVAIVGIPRDPMRYLQEALNLKHPSNADILQGSEVLEAIKSQIGDERFGMRKKRISFAKDVNRLCAELEDSERALHEALPQHLAKVLKKKRLKLFEKLLSDISYRDVGVVDEMRSGFQLVGWMPRSGIFPAKVRPPILHHDMLRMMADGYTEKTISAIRSSGDEQQDLELWSATMKEVQDGFMSGPFQRGDLPGGVVVSPRFGLWQKQKLRPIDNLTSSGINNTVGLSEKLKVDTIEECAATIKKWLQLDGSDRRLVGKTYDLRKAYRQLGVKTEELNFTWVGVWSPVEQKPMFFRMESLPFGGTGSVSAFLRVAHALKTLGVVSAKLVWTSFFDDFIVISKPDDARITDITVRHLFGALGWELATDTEKDRPFASVFSALGVQFDLSLCAEGKFTIGNTESRKTELSGKISEILESDMLSPQESMSLRSRLLFAESQVYGRVAKMALAMVGGPGLSGRVASPLGDELKFHLRWLRDRVLLAPPRLITVEKRSTFHVFLDGACTEYQPDEAWCGTSIGGVMFDEQGRGVGSFGEVLPQEIVAVWKQGDKEQLIFEAELLPYVVALHLWAAELKGASCFIYIDNEAAKSSWINGTADLLHARRMIHVGVSKEAELEVSPYFCRVPTHSNLADDPSRGSFDLCERMGAKRMRIGFPLLAQCVGLTHA